MQAWAEAELQRRGHAITGPIEQQRARPWSVVWRVPTDAGSVWLKASSPGSAHEPALADALARWCPDLVLHPIAVDARRGLMLTPDGGHILRTVLDADPDLARWEQLLARYAEAQRTLCAHAGAMTAMGVTDLGPAALPARVADLLADDDAMMRGLPGGMTDADAARLRDALAALPEQCERLAASGIGSSLQHDDLHDGNVLVCDESVTIFDWGDAYVGHPFATLLVTLRHVLDRAHLTAGPRDLQRLRDAYLEPWTAHAPLPALRDLVPVAMRVGTLARALTWHRILDGVPAAERTEHAPYVPGWLLEYLLDPDPIIAQL